MKKINTFISFASIILLFACDRNVSTNTSSSSLLDSAFEHPTKQLKPVLSDSVIPKKVGTFYGIDISHYQGNIIEKLNNSDSIHFIFCKATQGQHYVDPYFRINWREAKEKKIIRGTYHFYDCRIPPKVQAEHFYNTVGTIEDGDIAPVLDIEAGSMHPSVSAEQMVKDIQVFLKTIESKFNRKPILYTNYSFAQEHFKDPKFAEYKLWLAEYSKAKEPIIPDTWKEKGYFIWQKSADYHAHSTQLDFDQYEGDILNLTK